MALGRDSEKSLLQAGIFIFDVFIWAFRAATHGTFSVRLNFSFIFLVFVSFALPTQGASRRCAQYLVGKRPHHASANRPLYRLRRAPQSNRQAKRHKTRHEKFVKKVARNVDARKAEGRHRNNKQRASLSKFQKTAVRFYEQYVPDFYLKGSRMEVAVNALTAYIEETTANGVEVDLSAMDHFYQQNLGKFPELRSQPFIDQIISVVDAARVFEKIHPTIESLDSQSIAQAIMLSLDAESFVRAQQVLEGDELFALAEAFFSGRGKYSEAASELITLLVRQTSVLAKIQKKAMLPNEDGGPTPWQSRLPIYRYKAQLLDLVAKAGGKTFNVMDRDLLALTIINYVKGLDLSSRPTPRTWQAARPHFCASLTEILREHILSQLQMIDGEQSADAHPLEASARAQMEKEGWEILSAGSQGTYVLLQIPYFSRKGAPAADVVAQKNGTFLIAEIRSRLLRTYREGVLAHALEQIAHTLEYLTLRLGETPQVRLELWTQAPEPGREAEFRDFDYRVSPIGKIENRDGSPILIRNQPVFLRHVTTEDN